MNNFLELVMQFKHQINIATKPCRCCCMRLRCFCCFKGVFGTLDQMRFILEKNFDGRHFMIPSHIDGNPIDSMFFPASTERVLIKDELSGEVKKPSYLHMPTLIMCNPNAFFYQHMVS